MWACTRARMTHTRGPPSSPPPPPSPSTLSPLPSDLASCHITPWINVQAYTIALPFLKSWGGEVSDPCDALSSGSEPPLEIFIDHRPSTIVLR